MPDNQDRRYQPEERTPEESANIIFETCLTPGSPQWLVNNPDQLRKMIISAIREGGK